MDKKLKYLFIIPFFGTCILFIYLYVLSLRGEISKKKFSKSFVICAIVSAICWYVVAIILSIISKQIIYFDFNNYGMLITTIIGGYIMNAFTFMYFDKKWLHLYYIEKEEGESFFEVHKKKIMIIAFFLAIVITILAVVAIFAFDLI